MRSHLPRRLEGGARSSCMRHESSLPPFLPCPALHRMRTWCLNGTRQRARPNPCLPSNISRVPTARGPRVRLLHRDAADQAAASGCCPAGGSSHTVRAASCFGHALTDLCWSRPSWAVLGGLPRPPLDLWRAPLLPRRRGQGFGDDKGAPAIPCASSLRARAFRDSRGRSSRRRGSGGPPGFA